jgi:glycosyltransferase involved in cell wall biosynthesis
MKVDISIFGRFHAFDLAKQLNDSNILNKIITTYPKFKAREWGIENKKIHSKFIFEIVNRTFQKIGLNSNKFNYLIKKIYSKNIINFIHNSDILIGFSGQSLEVFKEAKKKDIITILERGSCHYDFRKKIIDQEYKKYGLSVSKTDPFRNRELEEYKIADYISIPSNFVKKSFLNSGIPENKLIINPYGVDLKTFYQVPKKDNIFRVLFVGEVSFRKGINYLLQAFFELNLKNSELVIVGNMRNEVKYFFKKFSNENIKYLGPKPYNQLYEIYSNSTVFVMPSIEEGLALVQLQAMACGLPLICSQNTGGEDLLSINGSEGFVVPTANVNSLKEKIYFLYKNQNLCSEMGKNAKIRVSQNYKWEDYGRRYIYNLKQIINKKNSD